MFSVEAHFRCFNEDKLLMARIQRFNLIQNVDYDKSYHLLVIWVLVQLYRRNRKWGLVTWMPLQFLSKWFHLVLFVWWYINSLCHLIKKHRKFNIKITIRLIEVYWFPMIFPHIWSTSAKIQVNCFHYSKILQMSHHKSYDVPAAPEWCIMRCVTGALWLRKLCDWFIHYSWLKL